MTVVRAKKTSKNADDFKVLIVGAVCAILIMMGSIIMPRMTEQRWFRDFTRLTPFHDVVLLYSQVSPDSITVAVGGTMVKRRCDFQSLYGYVIGSNGIRYRAAVDSSHEDSEVRTNRPPSAHAESWGPWTISVDTIPHFPPAVLPLGYEIYAEHVQCPTEPETQRNLFVKGDWANYTYTTKTGKPVAILEEGFFE